MKIFEPSLNIRFKFYLMKIVIVYFMLISLSLGYEYYKFGNTTCNKDTIWIDGFGGSKSVISDISVWTGLLMWRDYINSKGGICLDEKSQTDDECASQRMKVCVTLVELADSFTPLEKYEELIKDYIKDVSSITGFKPHFLVAPSYPELTNYTFKMVAQNNGKVTSEGINILVFSSASNDDVYTQNYKFMISPVIKLSKYPVSAVDLIANRYKVSRVVFMGDKSSSNELTTICDSFVSLLESAKGITVVSKRCSYEDDKVEAKTCNEDSDCMTSDGKKYSCTYPKYDFSQFASINGRMVYAEQWIQSFRDLDPDVLIFGSDDTVNLLKTLQTTVYLPKKVMGIYKSSMWYSPNEQNSPNYNSHFLIEFDENIEFGIKNRFMGTTSQFFKYFNDNFENYRSEEDNIFADGIDSLNNDYSLIGRGAAIGVTIQKIVELCQHFSIEVTRSFQSSETFNKLITLNQDNNFKVCIDSSTKKVTQPCSVSSCASGCVNWETFYGPITFDSSGTNSAKTGVVAQIQTNSTGDKYFTLLAPPTIVQCNQNGKVCSAAENNFRDCTCIPDTSAEWPWVPYDQEYMLKLSSAPGVVLFILALIIFLMNIGIIVRVVINIRQWNPLFVPYSTGLYLLYALFLTFSSFSLFDDRTKSQCLFEFFCGIITNALLFFCPLLTILEESTRLNETSSTLSKLQGILNVLVYSIYFFVTALFVFSSNTDAYVGTTVYRNGEQPFSYKYCTDSDYSYMCLVLACVSFLIHIVGIIKNRGLPSYYFRKLHYYFTAVTGIYLLVLFLPSLHNKDSRNYYIIRIILELFCSVLYISPFIRISSLFRLRKADELYKKPNDNKAELIHLFKKKLNRAFFYCFLAQENDVKCFELYEDIQTFKTKKTTVEINEMKRIIFTNHFSNTSIHSNLGITQEFIQLQRQEVDKAEGGNGFEMTENLIINYLASKHYFERFQLSDFYKAYKTNGTLFKMLKKHSIQTLVSIYEFIKVSIILDTTKDPEIFHQHVAFYNASIASKSSLFRSSFNSQNSARNKDVKLSIQPNKPTKKESISYLDSNNVPNSELVDSIRKEADSFNDTDSATSKKKIEESNRMLHTDSAGQVFDKSIRDTRRSSAADNNASQKTNGSELSRTEVDSDQQISNSMKDSVSTPSAGVVTSGASSSTNTTPNAKTNPPLTVKPAAAPAPTATATAAKKTTPNNVKPATGTTAAAKPPAAAGVVAAAHKQTPQTKVKSEDKSSASQNLISPMPGSTDKSDMKTNSSSDDVVVA